MALMVGVVSFPPMQESSRGWPTNQHDHMGHLLPGTHWFTRFLSILRINVPIEVSESGLDTGWFILLGKSTYLSDSFWSLRPQIVVGTWVFSVFLAEVAHVSFRTASNSSWKCPLCVTKENGVLWVYSVIWSPLSVMRTVAPQSPCDTMSGPLWAQGWTSSILVCWWSVRLLYRRPLPLQTWAPLGDRSRPHTE